MPQMMGEQIAAAAARMECLTSLVTMVASGVHVYNVTIIHCGKGKFNVTNIHCGKGAYLSSIKRSPAADGGNCRGEVHAARAEY